MHRQLVGTSLLLLSVTLGACRRKQVPVAEVPRMPSTAPSLAADPAQTEQMEAAPRDSLVRADAELARLRDALLAVVYFDYDAAEVTPDGRAALDAKLPILRANTAVRIQIAGHTDERGSDEYNMALGLRRAASARKYLVDRGVAMTRIDVVSFGEENPVASGVDEQAFSQNRRAAFIVVTGGDTLRTPR